MLSFNVARNPRKWRRLYQARWAAGQDFSINRNKALDEMLRTRGLLVAMLFLLAAVVVFVTMLTHASRQRQASMTREDWNHFNEQKRIEKRSPAKGNSGIY